LIVVLSIHQPSSAMFYMLDKLLLMSRGKTHYFGRVDDVVRHYETLNQPMPAHVNPAEFLLELVSTDFSTDREAALKNLGELQLQWVKSEKAGELGSALATAVVRGETQAKMETVQQQRNLPSLVLTLLHRSFVKSYRDVVAYGIRLAMYFGEQGPRGCVEERGLIDLLTFLRQGWLL
jgi:ABC-type multidrug transport system ATPase subunit